jgi:hypothetical protein
MWQQVDDFCWVLFLLGFLGFSGFAVAALLA